jgi:uncharacterized repeat protein (TIGR03803 family)
MNTLRFGGFAVSAGIAALSLTACGSLPPSSSGTSQASGLVAPGSSTNYGVVYRFGAPPDGNTPLAPLVAVRGTLYGTTNSGGSYDCSDGVGSYFGCGTVFSVTTGGTEKVLLAFTAGDGADPRSGLTNVKGMLYGTTPQGGCCGAGTVYSISTAGSETILHSFKRLRKFGENPDAELIDMRGLLYGSTYYGGRPGTGGGSTGTVFNMTAAGALDTLYRFNGGSDGANPSGRLLDVDGTLYGTTYYGGSGCAPGYSYSGSCGTVYSMTRKGIEKVLYRFKGGGDGVHPHGALLDVNGTLYGATAWGGAHRNCENNSEQTYGCGTIFSVTTSGKEKVLYSFTGGADGSHPNGSLINVNGTLYGTTSLGGADGDGTLFSITLSGTETVLHSFAGPPDGEAPEAGLIDFKNALYGTTSEGGSDSCGTSSYPNGCGTVFAFTLPR